MGCEWFRVGNVGQGTWGAPSHQTETKNCCNITKLRGSPSDLSTSAGWKDIGRRDSPWIYLLPTYHNSFHYRRPPKRTSHLQPVTKTRRSGQWAPVDGAAASERPAPAAPIATDRHRSPPTGSDRQRPARRWGHPPSALLQGFCAPHF